MRRVAEAYGMELKAVEVDQDHVHVYIGIPPQRAVGSAVRILKSISARRMFSRFPYLKRKLWAGELWGDGYFVRTIGEGVTAEMVDRYIKQHGAKEALRAAQAELFPQEKARAKRP